MYIQGKSLLVRALTYILVCVMRFYFYLMQVTKDAHTRQQSRAYDSRYFVTYFLVPERYARESHRLKYTYKTKQKLSNYHNNHKESPWDIHHRIYTTSSKQKRYTFQWTSFNIQYIYNSSHNINISSSLSNLKSNVYNKNDTRRRTN